jgi:Tfp pilus assembly protein PilO
MKRLQLLRIVVVAFGLAAAGLAGVCIYQYAATAATARALADQRDALEQVKLNVAELAKMQADGRQLNEKVLKRKAPWSWSEQLPVMVTQISGIVEQSGAKIDTLQPSPVVERDRLTRFPLRLTLTTELARETGLTVILQRLQQAVPLLGVEHFAVRAGQKPSEPLQVELTLSSYVIIEGRAEGGRP